MAEEGSGTPTLAESEREVYPIRVHEVMMQLQAENGLRHRDYKRYRKYLARRLQKTRRAAGVTCGRGRTFVKKEITVDIVSSADHLMVLLLNAERSWSYAMELKDASTLDGQRKLKHVAVSRLSRAARWAGQLQALCQQKCDAQTALETTAYADWMEGLLLMEREHWSEAISKFSSSKLIYQELVNMGSLQDQDVFVTRIEELEPPIRFCRFNSGVDEDTVDADADPFASSPDLSAKFAEMRLKRAATNAAGKSSSGGYSVIFAGQVIPVTDIDLCSLCTVLKASVEKIILHSGGQVSEKSREKDFLTTLGQVDSGLEMVSKLTSSLNSSNGSGPRIAVSSSAGKVGEMKESLSLLKNYFSYQRLFLMLAKNNTVCGELMRDSGFVGLQLHSFSGKSTQPFNSKQDIASAQRVHELAHLFDQRLGLIKDLLLIPGVSAYDLLKIQFGTEEFVCRTLRACYFAECYVVSRKWNEAVALIDHADGLAVTAQEKYTDFCSALDSTNPSEVDQFALFTAAKESMSTAVDGLEELVSSTRARHIATFALISTLPDTSASEEIQVAENDMDNDKKWSIMSRPLQWVEPVNQNEMRKNKATLSTGTPKQTLIVDEIPSGFNAIPCKPVFFDIAGNYIDFPDIDHRAGIVKKRRARGDTADAAEEEESSGGIVGVAKNVFGWFSG